MGVLKSDYFRIEIYDTAILESEKEKAKIRLF